MAFNLRNRSLLTVQDYTQQEFKYLLDLARDLKRAKYARTEQERIRRARRSVGYRIIAAADVEPVGVISFSSPQNIIAETSGKGVISGHAFKCVASI